MAKIEVRSAYAYDADAVSLETGSAFDPDEGRTQQQFAEECDINTIVKRFGLTGQLPTNLAMPLSGDFAEATDFHSAMNLVAQAQAEFMQLPAEVRARFKNDPGAVVEFLDDPANRDEAIKLGLVAAPPEVPREDVKS